MQTFEAELTTAPELAVKVSAELHDELHHGELIDNAHPVYPAGKGYYIWYRDSVPDEIDTNIISEEYELLYQCVNLVEYKSRLNMYVSVYSACLTVLILILLTSPFLPDALATFTANRSELTAVNNNISTAEPNTVEVKKPAGETPEGMTKNSIGFTDLKNNVMYVMLPNGKYSIQESSWNNEVKASGRVKRLNSFGLKYTNGKLVKAVIEKADIPTKGVWYRTRVGEFATINGAIEIAVKIRTEERTKNFSGLYVFPMSNFKV